jgi:broad specificity phosphatase PhoE
MVKTVLLLRHGETDLNRSGALRARLHVPLSDTGMREARQLAYRLRCEYQPTAICSSPRSRVLSIERCKLLGRRSRVSPGRLPDEAKAATTDGTTGNHRRVYARKASDDLHRR